MTYITSPHTLWDYDEQMYYTKVGTDAKNMPLLFTCWATTEAASRLRAENLCTKLNEYNASHQSPQNAEFDAPLSSNLADAPEYVQTAIKNIEALHSLDISQWDKDRVEQLNAYLFPFIKKL